MRILVVSQYFWPENFRINDLVAELTGRGNSVTVLTGLPNYPEGEIFAEYRSNPQHFMEFAGARIVRVPILPRGTGRVHLAMNYATFAISACSLGVWWLRNRQFDVILVFLVSPVTIGLPGVLLRSLKRVPLAVWVLDQWPESLLAVGAVRSRLALDLFGRLVSFIYRRCDLILAQSRSFIPQIARYAGDGRRIEYFPSWSDLTRVHDEVAPAPEIQAIPGMFTILFAGNIGDAQDFPAVLGAAELLKDREDIRWVIVGDGRRAEWVGNEIQRRGLSDRVAMMGRFPLDRMASFFRSADALLVSLKAEPIFAMTIPGKLQAYLAAGKPILAMLDGEGAELVERGGAGLVCKAGDSPGLARNVTKMAEMSIEQRCEMGDRGRQLSESEFERERLIGRLEDWLIGLQR